jgi:hypothetical protein
MQAVAYQTKTFVTPSAILTLASKKRARTKVDELTMSEKQISLIRAIIERRANRKKEFIAKHTFININKDVMLSLSENLKNTDLCALISIDNNFDEISEKIKLDITVATYDAAVEHLMQINILDALNLNRKFGQNFDCVIIPGFTASIGCQEGIYRYFTRNPQKEVHEQYFFSIIDLFRIIYNINYYKTVMTLCKLAKINVMEEAFVLHQKIKYADNLGIIGEADDEMRARYPVLYKYIHKQFILLKEMQIQGITHLQNEKLSVNNEAIFFASSQYISDLFKEADIKKGKSNVNNVLNMFCALGLLKKVPLNAVPQEYRDKAVSRAKSKAVDNAQNTGKHIEKSDKFFAVTFYQVPTYTTQVLIEAEKRAKALMSAGITATNVTTKNLEQALGVDIFRDVFFDTARFTEVVKHSNKYIKEKAKALDNEDDYGF